MLKEGIIYSLIVSTGLLLITATGILYPALHEFGPDWIFKDRLRHNFAFPIDMGFALVTSAIVMSTVLTASGYAGTMGERKDRERLAKQTLFTPEQICEIFNVPRSSVISWITQGKISCLRKFEGVAESIFISVSELESFFRYRKSHEQLEKLLVIKNNLRRTSS